MRPIKFRAWDKRRKEWLHPATVALIGNGNPMHYTEQNWSARICDMVDIQMFTGLHDRNNREVFEGDIVEGSLHFPQLMVGANEENSLLKMCGEVFYDHSGFRLKVVQAKSDPERHGMVNYFDFIGEDGEVFEGSVIGNIYETPALLSDTK